MPEKKPSERRRHLRYPPDPTETVMIQVPAPDAGTDRFRPQLAALPTEESRGGLRLVLLRHQSLEGLEAGGRLMVEVARLGPQPAEVRWVEEVDEEIVKIGVELISE